MAIQRAADRRRTVRVLLWGAPSAGKSSWALEATRYGSTLLLDYEQGTDELMRQSRLNLDNLLIEDDLPPDVPALTRYLRTLAQDPQGISTLVIDSISVIWDRHYQTHRTERDKTTLKLQWRELCDALVEVSRRMSVILTARTQVQRDGSMREIARRAFVESLNTPYVVDYWGELVRDGSGNRYIVLQKSRNEEAYPLHTPLRLTYGMLIGQAAVQEGVLRTGPYAGQTPEEAWAAGAQSYLMQLHQRRNALTPDEAADYRALLGIYHAQRGAQTREEVRAAGE